MNYETNSTDDIAHFDKDKSDDGFFDNIYKDTVFNNTSNLE